MPKELRLLWRIAEKSHPGDGLPLLALADKLEERGKKDDRSTAYALRWMAERQKKPRKFNELSGAVVWQWEWTLMDVSWRVPKSVSGVVPGYRYPTFRIACRALGKALKRCLQEALTENLRSSIGV